MIVLAHRLFQYFFHGVAGHFIMPEIIAELFELIKDHQILAGGAQFLALIEYFLDIRLGAGRLDGLAGNFRQPFEPFL